jgi:4-amino-4-deoxy-L-arabinose transferase-like glycosyltransferase
MKKRIWWILLFSFLIRLLLPLLAFIHTQNYRGFYEADSLSYIEPARQLIAYGRFVNNSGNPEILRTPGYPLLLIPGMVLGNMELVTIALQIFLSCLTVYFVYRIGLIVFRKSKVAAMCAFLCALEPLSIVYTSKILSETLFVSIFTCFLYYFLNYLESRSLRQLIISSITLGVSVYIRPVSLYLPFLLTVFLFIWVVRNKHNYKTLMIHACLFFAVSMGIIGCWQIRNMVVANYPGFSSTLPYNTYFNKAAYVLAQEKGIPYVKMQEQMGYGYKKENYFKNHPEQRTWTDSEIYQFMGKEGKKILAKHPLVYSISHIKGMLMVLFGPCAKDYVNLFIDPASYSKIGSGISITDNLLGTVKIIFQNYPMLLGIYLILGLISSVYLLLALIALTLKKNILKEEHLMIFISLCIYFVVVSGGPEGAGRYRHPIMPILCSLAGSTLSMILNRLSSTSRQEETMYLKNR